MASFDTTDRALSQKLRTAVGGLDGAPAQFGSGDFPEAPPYDTGAEIPVGKSPEEVNKWWKSLGADERNRLLGTWPDKLGNLNGIPVADRSAANKTILQQDLARPAEVAKSRGVTKEEVLAHPEKYGMAGPMMDRYNNALKVEDALNKDASDAKDANGRTPDILLMKYDPEAFGGDGAAAIAIGDPDKAANTSVMVSGLTTSVAAGTLSDGSGVNVYNEANKADWENSTAVVQWMGYDAPDDLAVAEPNMARNGAQILAPDVNALAVTHDGSPSHTTVIGHSYGSTTVADAAAAMGCAPTTSSSSVARERIWPNRPPTSTCRPTGTCSWARRRPTSSPISDANTSTCLASDSVPTPPWTGSGPPAFTPRWRTGTSTQSTNTPRTSRRDRSRCSASPTSFPVTGMHSSTTA